MKVEMRVFFLLAFYEFFVDDRAFSNVGYLVDLSLTSAVLL